MAYSALANDGMRLAPRLVLDPSPDAGSGTAPMRVVSAATSRSLRPMLEEVLLSGTARSVKRSEYRIGGKTGTAQKLGTGGVVGSFACFGPLENPRLAALVICDEPTKDGHHGSIVAAPYAVDLLRESLRYLGVTRSGETSNPGSERESDAGLAVSDPPEEGTR